MKLDKINDWLLLLSHVGIIGGLVLVAVQISQDQALTKAQLYSEATDARIAIHHQIMGQDPVPVIIKSLESPEQLTVADLRIMDAYLLTAVNEFRRLEVMRRAGLDVADAQPEGLLWLYFANPFAQEWWNEYKRDEDVTGDTVEAHLDRVITSMKGATERKDSTLDFFHRLQKRVSELPRK